ncbi:MAG: hypothetical protein K9W44_13535 [Candidatus Lokiarchaeota archaeon]|nr:hypothetical protein [Candidatus Harpocratesius repetitus]
MNQVNFRLKESEHEIAKIIAEYNGKSLAEYARQTLLTDIRSKRCDLAFKLVEEGKCGMKRAWKISGLSFREFLIEWNNRKASEKISDNLQEEHWNIVQNLDINKYLRTK